MRVVSDPSIPRYNIQSHMAKVWNDIGLVSVVVWSCMDTLSARSLMLIPDSVAVLENPSKSYPNTYDSYLDPDNAVALFTGVVQLSLFKNVPCW